MDEPHSKEETRNQLDEVDLPHEDVQADVNSKEETRNQLDENDASDEDEDITTTKIQEANEIIEEGGADKNDFEESTDSGTSDMSQKPSYASVAKAPPPPDDATNEIPGVDNASSFEDLGGSYEDIGTLSESRAKGESHSIEPLASDIKNITLGPDDIGTNIGDAFHQDAAHEEHYHQRLQAALKDRHPVLPPNPNDAEQIDGKNSTSSDRTESETDRTSSTPTPPKHPAALSPDHKRPSSSPDIGHKTKLPRHYDINPDTPRTEFKPDILLPELPRSEDDASTNNVLQGYLQNFLSSRPKSEGMEGGGSLSQSAEGASTGKKFNNAPHESTANGTVQIDSSRPAERVTRTEVAGAFNEMNSALSTLNARVTALEQSSTTQRSLLEQRISAREAGTEVETFTKLHPRDMRDRSEIEDFLRWGAWAIAIGLVAGIGGWVGAQVERGVVGKSLAEWIWRQGGRGGYAG